MKLLSGPSSRGLNIFIWGGDINPMIACPASSHLFLQKKQNIVYLVSFTVLMIITIYASFAFRPENFRAMMSFSPYIAFLNNSGFTRNYE